VYSPNQIALSTFLGSILAGSLLMAGNYRVFQKPTAVWVTISAGVVGTLALVGLSMVGREGQAFGVPLLVTFLMRALARSLQGRDFGLVIARGGAKHSTWRATGIAVLCLVGLVLSAFLVAFLFIDP
jgi:hypothetical protein